MDAIWGNKDVPGVGTDARARRTFRSTLFWRTAVLKFATRYCVLLAGGVALAGTLSTAVAESIESKYLANVQQVTHGHVKAGEGYFSPDGRSIVYQAVPRDYPFYQIYTQRLAEPYREQRPRRVSTGRGRTTCSYFSPDGKRILFASSHLDPNLDRTEEEERRKQAEEQASGRPRRYEWVFDAHMELFEADLDGGNLRRLTDAPGYDAEGAYSPDGKLIAFCSTRDGAPNLYLMNADGTNVRPLVKSSGYDGGPFISPDGRWVVYRTDREREGHLQVHVVGIDGKNDTPLTDNVGVNWAPYWHPTEPYLIWSGADHSDPGQRPNYDLWLVRYEVRDGRFVAGPKVRITDHASADVLPVFSPDGKRLMWTSNRAEDGSSQLFIADFVPPPRD
jgi:TolB protein